MDTSYGWLFDPKRCMECNACEAACKQWNKTPTGANIRLRRVLTFENGVFPGVSVTALSLSCNHCENALCVRVCPVKALYQRNDGIVLVDTERCVGCLQCAKFCPYDAPQFDMSTRKAYKCTMCVDRLAQGLQPACSTVCPTGALQWGKWDEIEKRGSDGTAHFKNPALTKPRIRFQSASWQS